MLDSFIFSLNATVPIFLLMILGMILNKLDIIDEGFASQMNKFVFILPLPVLLFNDLAQVNIKEAWDFSFVSFCFIVTVLSIGIAFLISFLLKEKKLKGEFIQATYRSSAALLGVAIIQNIYGTSAMGPLMIIGSVPLYNIMAVIVLTVFSPNTSFEKGMMKKTVLGILKNPLIIGIVLGICWSLFHVNMPFIAHKTLTYIGNLATPMGLIAMGATFDLKKALGYIRPALLATFFKLFGFCILFLPVAVFFGFVKEQLVAILIMLGSATTVSSFVMARNTGYEGILSSSVVMLSTMFCSFSITFWLFVLKTMSYL